MEQGCRTVEGVGMNRDDMIGAVRGREGPWDIVVIGGGAKGGAGDAAGEEQASQALWIGSAMSNISRNSGST